MPRRAQAPYTTHAGVEVQLVGPFFEVDPSKTFRQNARVMLDAIAEEGERAVKARAPFYTGSRGDPTAHIRTDIVGRTKSLSGKPWALTAVVSSLFHMRHTQNGKHYGYGGKLERKYRFFRRGIATVRTKRRDAEKLLRGLQ
jgi:hypothetical protein